ACKCVLSKKGAPLTGRYFVDLIIYDSHWEKSPCVRRSAFFHHLLDGDDGGGGRAASQSACYRSDRHAFFRPDCATGSETGGIRSKKRQPDCRADGAYHLSGNDRAILHSCYRCLETRAQGGG